MDSTPKDPNAVHYEYFCDLTLQEYHFLYSGLMARITGSCNCLTKSPDEIAHNEYCPYASIKRALNVLDSKK